MKRWAFVFLFLMMTTPMPALAEDHPRIKVYPDDETLELSGTTDEENAFIAYLELTAKGEDIDDFRFASHELKTEDGQTIAPRNIKLYGDRRLRDGKFKHFIVTLAEKVDEPGTYRGEAEIGPVGKARFASQRIDIKLVANALPDVALEPETFRVNPDLVTCKQEVLQGINWQWLRDIDCHAAAWIVSANVLQKKYPVVLRNRTLKAVTIKNTDLVIKDEDGKTLMTEQQLTVPNTKNLPAQDTDMMKLKFHRAEMTPGHYSGYINMTIEDGLEPMKVPVDIRVRTGPFWAIVALLLGALIGQLGQLGSLLDGTPNQNPRRNGGEGGNRTSGVTSGESTWFTRLRSWTGWRWVRIVGVKILAIGGAVILGLAIVYAGEQGATFGAHGLTDMLGIGAWGFAADLTSRGINKQLDKLPR